MAKKVIQLQEDWNPEMQKNLAKELDELKVDLARRLKEYKASGKSTRNFIKDNQDLMDEIALRQSMSPNATSKEKEYYYKAIGFGTPKEERIKGLVYDAELEKLDVEKLKSTVDEIMNKVPNKDVKSKLFKYTSEEYIKSNTYTALEDAVDSIYNSLITKKSTPEDIKKSKKYLLELIRRFKNEKYQFYTPNTKIEKFIKELAKPQNKNGLLTAANGVGKTAMAVNILAAFIWGGNKWFNYDYYKEWEPGTPKSIRIISRHTSLMGEIVPAIQEWFPKEKWKGFKMGQKYISRIETDNGWMIDLLSYDQSVDKHESVTRGFIWADEPLTDRSIFDAAITRLRRGGKMIMTAVPVDAGESAFLYEKFHPDNRIEIFHNPETGKDEEIDSGRFHLTADVHDACRTCDNNKRRGHLEHNQITFMLSNISESAKLSRMHGGFGHLSNRVFKSFDPKLHVIDPIPIPPQSFFVVCSLDPHPRKEDAVVWVAIDKLNNYYVIDELKFEHSPNSTLDLINAIRQKELYWQMNVKYRIIDPASLVVDDHLKDKTSSLFEQLREIGLVFQKGTKMRPDSDRNISMAFDSYTGDNENVKTNFPKLRIFNTCTKLIKQIQNYHYIRKPGDEGKEISFSSAKTKTNEDMVEALGRIMYRKFTYELLEGMNNQAQDMTKHQNTTLSSNTAQYLKNML